MKKLPLILACLIALGTAACNTVKGVGRDTADKRCIFAGGRFPVEKDYGDIFL